MRPRVHATAPPHRSYWLEEVAGDAPDAPFLTGRVSADIAIVGGGYVGLWTGIRIKEAEPACEVLLLEQDVCGGGASGRNGGFALSWWPKIASIAKVAGLADAVRIARGSELAIDEIRDFCLAHDIDVDFRRGGWLWTATTAAHVGAWNGVLDACARAGVEPFRRLEPAEVARRTGSTVHRAGVFEATGAIVQPAALARGLRRVALERGVRIFEHTRVRSFTRDRPVRLRCDDGVAVAETMVIATNAWAAAIRELSRAITVVSSDMLVTVPIPAELARIGWERDLAITDSQTMVDYYRATRDGRVAFGKGGWTIALGGRIGPAFDRNRRRAREVEADFRRSYPALRDAAIARDWSGAIDRTPDSLPVLGRLGGRPHIVYGVGWSGNGVGPSVIGGRILASLALRRDDEWARHPFVERVAATFPPEPVRFVGAHVVRAAVARKERAERLERRPSWLATKLAAFAPSGLEDKVEGAETP